MPEQFRASRARLHDMIGTQYTAVALANGAALITLGGIVGNVDDPNFAFRALAPALSLYSLGLIAAVTAIQTFSLALSHQLHVEVGEWRLGRLIAEAAIPPINPFAPVDLSGAKLIFGENADEEFRRFTLANLLSEKNRQERLEHERADALAAISSASAKVLKEKIEATRWFTGSVFIAFAATVALFIAGYQGFQPTRPIVADTHASSATGTGHPPATSAPILGAQLPKVTTESGAMESAGGKAKH